jgi:hypothetical protein
MRKACNSIWDETLKILFWDWEEVIIALAVVSLGQFLCDFLLCFGSAAGFLAVLYVVKKGQPAGAFVHWLHRMELCRAPGLCRARPRIYHAGS